MLLALGVVGGGLLPESASVLGTETIKHDGELFLWICSLVLPRTSRGIFLLGARSELDNRNAIDGKNGEYWLGSSLYFFPNGYG